MLRALVLLLLAALAAVPARPAGATDQLPLGAEAFADVLARVLPAVVNLSVSIPAGSGRTESAVGVPR